MNIIQNIIRARTKVSQPTPPTTTTLINHRQNTNNDDQKSKSLTSKNVDDNDESSNIDQQLDKNQASQRYNMRSRPNKEPELIEILTSSEEDDDKSNSNDKKVKKNSNGQIELFNEFRDETYSFRPWAILHTDIECQSFKLRSSKISSDFQFHISIEFIRFGSFHLKEGIAVFKSNKGISLSSKLDENQISITIGKEDIIYCAAFCHEKINILFLHPTSFFTSLFREKTSILTETQCLDPNSQNEEQRRIVILFQNKNPKKVFSFIFEYFNHIKAENLGRLDFITLLKAKEIASKSLDEELYKKLFDEKSLKDKTELAKIIAQYPSADKPDSLNITVNDLNCLDEGEFLNDNIISFYLKYLFNEKINETDRTRTHIFNSFFYIRLTQSNKKTKEQIDMNPSQRRHSRVKKWTKDVNIFDKDFIIIPINKNQHWYLAIICYPNLTAPMYGNEKREPKNSAEICVDESLDLLKTNNQNEKTQAKQLNIENDSNKKNEQLSGNSESVQIEIDEESYDEAESVNEDNNLNNAIINSSDNICTKMPCILIFDSLTSCTRGNVIGTLREYLQCEWDTKFPNSKRSFTKDTIFGSRIKVPSQNNYFDCGIYLLQYVENFFLNPIKDFTPPIDLKNWFSEDVTSKKREEIKSLILEFEEKQKYKNEIKTESGVRKVRSLSQTSISNDSIDNCMEVNSNSNSSNSCKKYKTDNNNSSNGVQSNPVKGTGDIIEDIKRL